MHSRVSNCTRWDPECLRERRRKVCRLQSGTAVQGVSRAVPLPDCSIASEGCGLLQAVDISLVVVFGNSCGGVLMEPHPEDDILRR